MCKFLRQKQTQDHDCPGNSTDRNQPVLDAKHLSMVVVVVGIEHQLYAHVLVWRAIGREVEFLCWTQTHEPSELRSRDQFLGDPSVVLWNKQVSTQFNYYVLLEILQGR